MKNFYQKKRDKNNLVEVGKIFKAHGVNGEFQLLLYDSESGLYACFKKLIYFKGKDSPEILEIENMRKTPKGFIVRAKNVGDRDSAEKLKGVEVFFPREELPPLAEGEYYHHDLIGSEVITENGKKIGKVFSIMTTNIDIFMVRNDKNEEFLIPLIKDAVKDIDSVSKKIIIFPMEGLF
jgi:16S rRNA processing protein RimM